MPGSEGRASSFKRRSSDKLARIVLCQPFERAENTPHEQACQVVERLVGVQKVFEMLLGKFDVLRVDLCIALTQFCHVTEITADFHAITYILHDV